MLKKLLLSLLLWPLLLLATARKLNRPARSGQHQRSSF